MRFTHRTVLVTGAASGIGAATARAFAAEGARVYAADHVFAADGRGSAADGRGSAVDGSPAQLALDVTDAAAWEAAIAHVVREAGALDVLVQSAGVAAAAPIASTSLDEWRRVLAVNLDGAFLGLRHAIPVMQARGGAIVNVTSASGLRPAAGAAAYSTSKAALAMLTRVAAKECRDRGWPIRVNAVAPAGVRTPMWSAMPFFQDLVAAHGSEDAAYAAMEAASPGTRFSSPEDIAAAILFLASDDARQITGVEVPVDGGYVL